MKKRKMPNHFIVKVQLPIVTNDPNPQALVYDRYRRLCQHMPITKELLAAMGGEFKRYFCAYMEGTELHLDGQAGEQSW